jgi:hypothetical protein
MAEGKPPVIDWDRVVNKNVRSKEGEPIGNIVAHMGDSLHIETTGSRGQYMIPKEHVAHSVVDPSLFSKFFVCWSFQLATSNNF